MPWQQHVADVALELDPETGELYYEEVVITVPRQSGKTTLLIALMVWRCVMMARRLALPQTVTYLAQFRACPIRHRLVLADRSAHGHRLTW